MMNRQRVQSRGESDKKISFFKLTACKTYNDTIRYDTIRYDTIQYNTIRYDMIYSYIVPVWKYVLDSDAVHMELPVKQPFLANQRYKYKPENDHK